MNIAEEYSKGNIPLNNEEILKSFYMTDYRLKDYDNIVCSISGGSDSDIILDLLERVNKDIKSNITYVFFNTGLEYQATKDHLKELEKKYNIEIQVINAKTPIPITCKEYGQPFLSKQVSEFMMRLQKHNFKWEDKPFEELCKKYPRCISALQWWCNTKGEGSSFNISRNKMLKEFIIANPPKFKISNKCCKFAKKDLIHDLIKNNNFDLSCNGVRKAEGGARATAYKNCFSEYENKIDQFRPIFWYKKDTKKLYEEFFDVRHSKCYTEYGLERTGCCGCPYGKDFEEELKIIKKYEPKLYNAANYIFKDSYEYTRAYIEFKKNMRRSKS